MSNREIAYHEAGHAVMHVLAKVAFGQTVITEDGGAVYGVRRKDRPRRKYVAKDGWGHIFNRRSLDQLYRHAATSLAGAAAEAILREDDVIALDVRPHEEWIDDLEGDGQAVKVFVYQIRKHYNYFTNRDPFNYEGSPEFEEILMAALSVTLHQLHEHWPAVEAVAEALLEHGSLSNRKVRDLFKAAPTLPPVSLDGYPVYVYFAEYERDGEVSFTDINGEEIAA